MKVALTYNCKNDTSTDDDVPLDYYAEWDDRETVEAVASALAAEHEVVSIEATREAYFSFLKLQPDIVFNIAEGDGGESREAHVPAMLEFLGIPYTGSGPLTLSLCLNKARAKEVLTYHRVPTPAHFVANGNLQEHIDSQLQFPLIVKPLHEGSSKGIRESSLVEDAEQLRAEVERVVTLYNEPAVVEQFLAGREFTVAMLGNAANARVLPIVEILYESLPAESKRIYSYEAKWVWDVQESPLEIFKCPADITDRMRKQIEATALSAYRVLNCLDWCRIDMRLDHDGVPNVLEVNPLPGILPDPAQNSCFPKAARAVGMSYEEMILSVLNAARERYGI